MVRKTDVQPVYMQWDMWLRIAALKIDDASTVWRRDMNCLAVSLRAVARPSSATTAADADTRKPTAHLSISSNVTLVVVKATSKPTVPLSISRKSASVAGEEAISRLNALPPTSR